MGNEELQGVLEEEEAGLLISKQSLTQVIIWTVQL